jgi:hypothetical protein
LLSTNCRLRSRLSQACHRIVAKSFAQPSVLFVLDEELVGVLNAQGVDPPWYQRVGCRIMRRRSPNASLSPAEVSSLRRVASGLAKFLSSDARELLMSMGLISVTLRGRLVLTEKGKQRLAKETARQPAGQTPNPFGRPPGN